MSEIQIGPGDAVSRLLQVYAKEFGLKRVWSGIGHVDARALIADNVNLKMMKECIYDGVKDLYAMPELTTLPEAVQAKMMAIILNARACVELQLKDATKAPA